MITEINKDNFTKVINSNKVVVVDYWASWCGPCRMMSRVYHDLAEEMKDKVKLTFASCKIDDCMELATNENVGKLPTFIVYVDGAMTTQASGAMTKDALRTIIEGSLN